MTHTHTTHTVKHFCTNHINSNVQDFISVSLTQSDMLNFIDMPERRHELKQKYQLLGNN